MITGVLLAIARISGETAPLLFTALNNQFWSLDMNAPIASLPVVIFQFALSPYRGLAAAGLDRRADHHDGGACAQHHRPAPRGTEKNIMSLASFTTPDVTRDQVERRGPRREGLRPRPRLLLRRQPRAEDHQRVALSRQGDRLHRPVRLRQVHAAARPQPHVRPLSQPARHRRRDCSTARTFCRQRRTSTCCAPRSAWCSRSRRRSR